MDNLENRNETKKKFDFKKRKENTIHSLFEVERFLRDFKQIAKGVKLYKIMKW